MEYIAWFIFIFLGVRTFISLVNLLSKPWLKDEQPEKQPMISVLIPARNEERSIGSLLSDLSRQDYPQFEVLVYDDQSDDKTPDIVKQYEHENKHFRYIAGETLPEGWNGKNHACYQLAREAGGDYLLFLDADVRAGEKLLSKSLSFLQKKKLNLLSIFPKQEIRSVGERLTVPIMNWILVSLLPLPLVRILKFPSLAAANGQFMLFDVETYQQNQWHEQLKSVAVEDIEIARTMKTRGYCILTLLGDDSIRCRMYETYGEAVKGFSRNVHAYFGNSHLVMGLFVVIVTLGFIPVWVSYGEIGLLIYLGLVILNRVVVSAASSQGVITNVILAPLQVVSLLHISLKSLKNRFSGKTSWKGRTIKS
ncbi:MAG: glycosyltransferase [Bacteroidales bacterium]|nr:glycosyltransferase [Bacteroidales bacterium]MCF8334784.1 glycosyltransferase [Bacteroidales bacterium]